MNRFKTRSKVSQIHSLQSMYCSFSCLTDIVIFSIANFCWRFFSTILLLAYLGHSSINPPILAVVFFLFYPVFFFLCLSVLSSDNFLYPPCLFVATLFSNLSQSKVCVCPHCCSSQYVCVCSVFDLVKASNFDSQIYILDQRA